MASTNKTTLADIFTDKANQINSSTTTNVGTGTWSTVASTVANGTAWIDTKSDQIYIYNEDDKEFSFRDPDTDMSIDIGDGPIKIGETLTALTHIIEVLVEHVDDPELKKELGIDRVIEQQKMMRKLSK